MAVTIVDTGTASFTLNGISYLKNFQSLVSGNSIRIVNAYDSKLVLLPETLYSEFTVDGSTFANVLLLQEDLVSKLFNRPATGTGLLETSKSNTLSFHNTAGVRHGTWSIPITGNLVLSSSGLVEGGVVVVIWNGSSNPSITGGTIQSWSGLIDTLGTYSIYIHYINGRFNINIFNVDGTGIPGGDTTPPATMIINNILDYTGADITPPATMTLISII